MFLKWALKGIVHTKILIGWKCIYCFFIGTDYGKFSITSLAHQLIFCIEWVPSEWNSKQWKKHPNITHVFHMTLVHQLMPCEMKSCSFFISCLEFHSDGTHSMQRMHLWTSDVMLNFSKKKLILRRWPDGEGELICKVIYLTTATQCCYLLTNINCWKNACH